MSTQGSEIDLSLTDEFNAHAEPKDHPRLTMDLFKIVNDHYRNDINAVWQRSQFFVTAHVALIVFVASRKLPPESFVSVSLIGIFLGALWLIGALVTAKWISVWRAMVITVESHIFKRGPYQVGEVGRGWHQKFRPQHVSWFLALTSLVFWVYVGIHHGLP